MLILGCLLYLDKSAYHIVAYVRHTSVFFHKHEEQDVMQSSYSTIRKEYVWV